MERTSSGGGAIDLDLPSFPAPFFSSLDDGDLEVGAGLLEWPRLLLRVDRRVDAGVRLTGMVGWRLSVASAVVNPCVLRDVDVEQVIYKFK